MITVTEFSSQLEKVPDQYTAHAAADNTKFGLFRFSILLISQLVIGLGPPSEQFDPECYYHQRCDDSRDHCRQKANFSEQISLPGTSDLLCEEEPIFGVNCFDVAIKE